MNQPTVRDRSTSSNRSSRPCPSRSTSSARSPVHSAKRLRQRRQQHVVDLRAVGPRHLLQQRLRLVRARATLTRLRAEPRCCRRRRSPPAERRPGAAALRQPVSQLLPTASDCSVLRQALGPVLERSGLCAAASICLARAELLIGGLQVLQQDPPGHRSIARWWTTSSSRCGCRLAKIEQRGAQQRPVARGSGSPATRRRRSKRRRSLRLWHRRQIHAVRRAAASPGPALTCCQPAPRPLEPQAQRVVVRKQMLHGPLQQRRVQGLPALRAASPG